MEKGLEKLLAKVKREVIFWIYFPKGSSGIRPDLNRDTGWTNSGPTRFNG
jgi:hypothetical protein